MLYAQIGDLRLCSITQLQAIDDNGKLITRKRPLMEGLGLEQRAANGESWYVISFIRWDDHEWDIRLEPVGSRLIDALDISNFENFQWLVRYAKRLFQDEAEKIENAEND